MQTSALFGNYHKKYTACLIKVLAFCWAIDPCLAAQTDETSESDQRIPYVLNIHGLDNTSIKQKFLALSHLNASTLQKFASNHTDTRSHLSRYLSQDIETLSKLLRSEGYYNATIAPEIAPAPGLPNTVVVFIHVDSGVLYHFGTIDIGGSPPVSLQFSLAKIGLRADAPARTSAVLDSLETVKNRLPQIGNPFFSVGEPDVVVDHNTSRVDVTIPLDIGPTVAFGVLSFAGPEIAKASHLMHLARFSAGQIYDQRKIDDLREALLSTSLFSSLSITPIKRILPKGAIAADIVVEGQATRARTVSFSGGYSTTEGPRIDAGSQHRNLLRGEERINLTGTLGTMEQSAIANLRKANFNVRDQNLLGNLGLVRNSTTKYRSITANVSVGLERQTERLWQKKWTYSVQAQFQIDNVKTLQRNAQTINQVVSTETFKLVSLPSVIHYDSTSDLFDPHAGLRLSLALTPELSVQKSAHTYFIAEIQAGYYHTFNLHLPVTFAAHGRLGSILGGAFADIPVNKLFYSGGGGSVRGYGYQRLSVDATGTPLGGKSIAEIGLEARLKISPTVGIVPFIDGGNVYAGNAPQLGGFRWGAGLGLRYYTNFAPVRVDIATPVNRRRFVSAAGQSFQEAPVQIYVSVGQSF